MLYGKFCNRRYYLQRVVSYDISSSKLFRRTVTVTASYRPQIIPDGSFNIVEAIAYHYEFTGMFGLYFPEYLVLRDKGKFLAAIETVKKSVQGENSPVSFHIMYTAVAEEYESVSYFFQM